MLSKSSAALGLELRRVGQAEPRAIQSDQPPAPPEGLGVGGGLGQRAQAQTHQLGEHGPRSALAPFTERTVGQGVGGKGLGEMLGKMRSDEAVAFAELDLKRIN
ncbi:MAG: hypothetical protein HZA92_10310 [Verrucomicrobia bacterium]|nr:hypothetical protein [Verrucomicrobiota bacterium]